MKYPEKENIKVKRTIKTCFTVLIVWLFTSSPAFSQTKLAQTGFNFLNVATDARASAMGEAVNSLTGYSGALFQNPASMADLTNIFSATFSVNNWIADIRHLAVSTVFAPFNGDYGVLGLSLQSVDYGDIQGTRVANNEQSYEDTEILKPSALAVGIGYSKMLNDKFGVGAQVRFAYQWLGESLLESGMKSNNASAVAYDFGTIYKTGIESLTFGMSVRNFSKEVKFEKEGFQLPLIFTIGISADVLDFFDLPVQSHSLLLTIDSTHPRSHPEQMKFGAEYRFMNIFFLRGGFVTANSEDSATFGAGISSYGVEVDYAYTPFGVFDNVQRFTARISL